MLVMRKVAMAASAGFVKPEDFASFWPLKATDEKEVPSWAATSLELRKELLEKFKK